jgi:phosphonate utilization associated putative membrane protein
MTWTVMLAVLIGAMLHASWNVMVKSSSDKTLDTALIHLCCSFIAIPFCLALGLPPAESWPYLAASVLIHIGYYFALAQAYHHGELGLTYPLMRGVAPLMVAIGALAFIDGASMSLLGWTGVALICLGVLILGMSAGLLHHRRAIFFALLNSAIIALYTLIDAKGVRTSGNAAQYIAALFAFDGWAFAFWVLYLRRGRAISYFKERWAVGLGGAAASVSSYAIALWAMTVAPVAAVAALRETSVLFAVLFGTWFLKEKLTRRRAFSVVIIITGAAALRLA